MDEALTALVLLYFGSTPFFGIEHYKSDGGAGVGIFEDSRFKTSLFLRERGGWPILSGNRFLCVCTFFSTFFLCGNCFLVIAKSPVPAAKTIPSLSPVGCFKICHAIPQ